MFTLYVVLFSEKRLHFQQDSAIISIIKGKEGGEKLAKANNDIRTEARRNGVYLYEIARELGVHETTVVRWLRGKLTETQTDDIRCAIANVAEQKNMENL